MTDNRTTPATHGDIDPHFARMLEDEAAARARHKGATMSNQGRELPPHRSGGGADNMPWKLGADDLDRAMQVAADYHREPLTEADKTKADYQLTRDTFRVVIEDALARRLDALRSEPTQRAPEVTDTERLDWLDEHGRKWHLPEYAIDEERWYIWGDWNDLDPFESLRDAIDAARKAPPRTEDANALADLEPELIRTPAPAEGSTTPVVASETLNQAPFYDCARGHHLIAQDAVSCACGSARRQTTGRREDVSSKASER